MRKAILAVVIVGLLASPAINADQAVSATTTTACFKYNMKVRAARSLGTTKVVRVLPTTKATGTVVIDGWLRVEGGLVDGDYIKYGWVKLGPPNQIPCRTTNGSPSGIGGAIGSLIEGIRRYTADLDLAQRASAQLHLVAFCDKHRSSFGWKKCYAQSNKLFVHSNRLRSTKTNLEARRRARGYVSSFLRKDLPAQTARRLDDIIDDDLRGIPANRWNSVELKRLERRAEVLADSLKTKRLNAFVDSAHPELKSTAERLRSQRPKFVKATKPYESYLADCQLSALQQKMLEQGEKVGGQPTYADNIAVCDFAPGEQYAKVVVGMEKKMPLPSGEFNSMIDAIPGKVHDLVLSSIFKQATMSREVFAKHRGLGEYLEYQLRYSQLLEQVGDPKKVNHPCDTIKKKAKNETCKSAVNILSRFDTVVAVANRTGYESFKACPRSETAEQFHACFTSANQAWVDKTRELMTPKASLMGFISANRWYLIGVLIIIGIMHELFARLRTVKTRTSRRPTHRRRRRL